MGKYNYTLLIILILGYSLANQLTMLTEKFRFSFCLKHTSWGFLWFIGVSYHIETNKLDKNLGLKITASLIKNMPAEKVLFGCWSTCSEHWSDSGISISSAGVRLNYSPSIFRVAAHVTMPAEFVATQEYSPSWSRRTLEISNWQVSP